MAKAKQLPSGSWRCRPSFTDEYGVKHIESFTADTKRRAEALAVAWQEGMLEKKKGLRKQSLGDAIDEYLETCRCAGISPATIRSYKASRNNAFAALINLPVNKIGTKELQAWINARSKIVAPKTLKNNLALLSVVFKAEGEKVNFDSLKMPKGRRKEMQIPSDSQVTALLKDVYDDNDMYIAIALAALMGLRRSEICALRWSDIIVQDDTAFLDVSKALVLDENYAYVQKEPKTESGYRILPIPDSLHAELKRRRNLKPNIVNISPNAITERYHRLVERLSLPPRFHNLRHYHASVMLREGVPEKYIVADMGHSSFEMVKRVYGHVMQEKKASISQAMASHASAILSLEPNLTQSTQAVDTELPQIAQNC